MPEASLAAPVKTWPRPLTTVLLVLYVLADAYLWILGFYYLMTLDQAGPPTEWEGRLFAAFQYLTYALVVMLVGGWAWRWAVAAGYVGGRPTARFGGA